MFPFAEKQSINNNDERSPGLTSLDTFSLISDRSELHHSDSVIIRSGDVVDPFLSLTTSIIFEHP